MSETKADASHLAATLGDDAGMKMKLCDKICPAQQDPQDRQALESVEHQIQEVQSPRVER
eukprot:5266180-Amphidinium_carterae.2